MIPARWLDDAALLKRALAGDAKAAATMVERLMRPAHSLAWRMTGNSALAEDIVQEAFARLWQSAARWEPRASVSTFFTRIVINLCYDHHRAAGTIAMVEDPSGTAGAEAPAVDADLFEEMAARQSRSEVRAALHRLSVRHRAVLVMWAYSDLDVREIAAAMDMNENAVHQLLHRARAALRAQLENGAGRKGKSNAA